MGSYEPTFAGAAASGAPLRGNIFGYLAAWVGSDEPEVSGPLGPLVGKYASPAVVKENRPNLRVFPALSINADASTGGAPLRGNISGYLRPWVGSDEPIASGPLGPLGGKYASTAMVRDNRPNMRVLLRGVGVTVARVMHPSLSRMSLVPLVLLGLCILVLSVFRDPLTLPGLCS